MPSDWLFLKAQVDSVAMTTGDRIKLGFGTALVSLVVVGALSYRTTRDFLDTNRSVLHGQQALRELDGVLAAVDELDSARLAHVFSLQVIRDLRSPDKMKVCQGCHPLEMEQVLSKSKTFVEVHPSKVAALQQRLAVLRELSRNESTQQRQLDQLQRLVQEKLAIAQESTTSPERLQDFFAGPQALFMDRGIKLGEQIRSLIGEMEKTESEILLDRVKRSQSSARSQILVVTLLTALTACLLVAAAVVIGRDLAARQRLEEQLRQAAKMEAIGRLAGGIAHDFNNLLMTILGYTEVLADELGAHPKCRTEIDEIRRAGNTAASLTRQLLAFGRRQPLQVRTFDLNSVVADLSGMLRRTVGERHTVETTLREPAQVVHADPAQIQQVLIDLVLNARDAMPEGGPIEIEIGAAGTDAPRECWGGTLPPGRYAVLTVRDQGAGLDSETRSQIFEPFFTTKGKGKGSGLGLSTVYGIVKQSGGEVAVSSEAKAGTCFQVFLPAAPAGTPAPQPVPTTNAAEAGHTIMVVEDEPPIRRLIVDALTERGYTVLAPADPFEALRAAEDRAAKIQLLLTDVVMPGMNGPELARKLRAIRPEIKVVYMSGYVEDHALRAGIGGESVLISKPFQLEDLLRKLNRALDAGDASSTADARG